MSITSQYELMRSMLESGWTTEVFEGNKNICAGLLRCSYMSFKFDHAWQKEHFYITDFDHFWDKLQNDVRDEFVRICLSEMENK